MEIGAGGYGARGNEGRLALTEARRARGERPAGRRAVFSVQFSAGETNLSEGWKVGTWEGGGESWQFSVADLQR